MDDGKDGNLFRYRAEIDGVRETPYQRAADFTVDARYA
jgi:hypothetical protein